MKPRYFTDQELIDFIQSNQDMTIEEIGAHFCVWSRTIRHHMKRLGITKQPAKMGPKQKKQCWCGEDRFSDGCCRKHYRESLIEKGICVDCLKPNDRQGRVCTTCLERARRVKPITMILDRG